MVRIGNYLFHYRNRLFPVLYVCLFIPSPKIFGNPLIPIVLGFLVAVSGQMIRFATIGLKYIIRGGRNRRVYAEDLVTEGLFAHVRNPLYVGNALVIIGLGIMSNSLFFNLIMTPLFLFSYQAIVRAEENYLQDKFGPGFIEYCAEVNRWIPNFKGLGSTLNTMEFHWPRVIVKEYGATYVWLTGATLIIFKTEYFYQGGKYFDDYRNPLVMVLIGLLVLYLTARHLKKSKILSGE